MAEYEQEAGELLWKYIEEIKRAEAPESVNFIARTPVDPVDMAEMLPLADALENALRPDATPAAGYETGRLALAQLIAAEPVPYSPHPLPVLPWWKQLFVLTPDASRRQAVLLCTLVGLLLILAAGWATGILRVQSLALPFAPSGDHCHEAASEKAPIPDRILLSKGAAAKPKSGKKCDTDL